MGHQATPVSGCPDVPASYRAGSSPPLCDRSLQQWFSDSWLLSDPKLTAVRGHYGEEVAFIFAYYDLKNRALLPVAVVGVVVYALRFVPGMAGLNVLDVLQCH